LPAPARWQGNRGLFSTSQMCCAPAPPPVPWSPPSEATPLSPASPASSTPEAARPRPSPESHAVPVPDLPDSRTSAAPRANGAAPSPASLASRISWLACLFLVPPGQPLTVLPESGAPRLGAYWLSPCCLFSACRSLNC